MPSSAGTKAVLPNARQCWNPVFVQHPPMLELRIDSQCQPMLELGLLPIAIPCWSWLFLPAPSKVGTELGLFPQCHPLLDLGVRPIAIQCWSWCV